PIVAPPKSMMATNVSSRVKRLPACDLQVAWNLFDKDARLAFRDTMNVSDAMWARGRGWALSVGAIALPYYKVTNPVLAGISKKALDTVIADYTHRHK
ncbi:MAG: hypothetical protein AAFQ52_13685, partial [Chloroflexota bacterium]